VLLIVSRETLDQRFFLTGFAVTTGQLHLSRRAKVHYPVSAMTFRILILGTGTSIGKTHLGVALTSALASGGVDVCALKPIESGVGPTASDAQVLAAVSTFPVKPPPYVFREPLSPHLAARRAGELIHLPTVAAWVDSHPATVAVIETAGALLSPLGPNLTNLDLARCLHPQAVILVAPDRLGVLHDVTASLHAWRTLAPDLPSPLVVLQPPPTPDTSSGTNTVELTTLAITSRSVLFPRADPSSAPSIEAARELLFLLLHATP
jgi:dethiobiotin synthetase